MNPKDSKEPVPPQLELLAQTIIVPLLAVFHRLVEQVQVYFTHPRKSHLPQAKLNAALLWVSGVTQVLANHDGKEVEIDKILLIVCKCVYFSVSNRS